jgi:hypothetical protein
MGSACVTHGIGQGAYRICRNPCEGLDVEGRVILKLFLKK